MDASDDSADHTTEQLVAIGRATGSLSYAPAPIILERGEGMRLYDKEGNDYLDFMAGIAVSSLGHAHPDLTAALLDQVGKLLHVSNAFFTEPQVLLQQALVDRSFADRVFLCNSGAEANEAAIKLTRRYQRVVREMPRFEIITFERSFHGRTYGAISATAQPKYHAGFEPMVPGFVHAPFGDLGAVASLIGPHTAGILVEPVQGEGGVRPARRDFLVGLRELCDEHGLVLIFDEVQTGVGRCGALFAYERFGVEPDVLCLAKGIAGGVPLGAMLARGEVAEGFERGSHATTYGGNPLASRAGLTVLRVIERDRLAERARETGAYFREKASELVVDFDWLGEVRGLGLLNGIPVLSGKATASRVVAASRDEGLLHNTAAGDVLRFVPPLIASRDDVDEAIERLRRALARVDADADEVGA